MKIFLIIPTLQQGGAERVMSELASKFSNLGYKVHLVLLANSVDFYTVNSNVLIQRLGFINHGSLKKIIAEYQTFLKLRKLLKTEKPDAVLSFMEKYNVFTILSSRFLNLKVFVSDRSNPNKKFPKHIALLKKITYRYATGIVAQTSLAKNILEKTTKNNNIKVIPNPVKQVKLYPEIKREKIVLNVGRLIPEKGQKFLLEAFSKLNLTDWKLVILGDGPLRTDLEMLAKDFEIQDNLYMPGAVNNVDKWLAKASIFAFPSVSEGFPNALVEAMAAGLPCVSFDCDAGPRDIIKNGENGFLIPLKRTEKFSKKIHFLIEHPELRLYMGKKASAIKNELEISKIAKEYLSFFDLNRKKINNYL